MHKKLLLVILLWLCYPICAFAEPQPEPQPEAQPEAQVAKEALAVPAKNGMGHAFGVGGLVLDQTVGFSYKKAISDRIQFQLTCLPLVHKERVSHAPSVDREGREENYFVGSIGNSIVLAYILVDYAIPMAELPHASARVYLTNHIASRFNFEGSFSRWHIGFGGGPGAELFYSKHFSCSLEVPLMFFFKTPLPKYKFALDHISPSLNLGIHYYL